MANYVRVTDKRNTSKGITPNKAIKRSMPAPAIKKSPVFRKQGR